MNAALKEDLEFFVFFQVCGPLAQAIRRRQYNEFQSFTKPGIGLQIIQSTTLRRLGRPGATFQPGMSSATSNSSSSRQRSAFI